MPTNITTDKPWYTPALGLADMLAATARGVTRGTLGLPGDLENLVRMGIGGKQYLPTSDDFDKHLPPLNPLVYHSSEVHPYDRLGQFYNVPIYGGAFNIAGKGIKKLGGAIVGGETNLGRREFAKKAGAIGLGSTALAKAFKYLDDLEKATPVAKEIEDVAKASDNVAAPAAKAATKYKYNSLKEYNGGLTSKAKEYYTRVKDDPNWVGRENDYVRFWRGEQAKLDEIYYNSAKDQVNTYGGGSPNQLQLLDEFSPQAKAEMKQFKTDMNPFSKQDSNTMWEYLDDYALTGGTGLGIKLVKDTGKNLGDSNLIDNILTENNRQWIYDYNKSNFKGTLEEYTNHRMKYDKVIETKLPNTNPEKQTLAWKQVEEAKRIMESTNSGPSPNWMKERQQKQYEEHLKNYMDMYGNVTSLK